MTADQVWRDAQTVGKGDIRDWGQKVEAAIAFGFGSAPEQFPQLADLDDPEADHTLAIEAAAQSAAAKASAFGTSTPGAGGTHFPRAPVYLQRSRRYNVTRNIPIADARIAFMGHHNLIRPLADFAAPLFTFTGGCEHMLLQGVSAKATSVGCWKWDAQNAAGAKVTVDDCEVIRDDYGSTSSVGFDYKNQSSIFVLKNTRTAGMPHFLWNRDCDFVELQNNNYGNTSGFTYPNVGDGLIRNDRGNMSICGGLFNGGPDDEGAEMAYIRNGVPGGFPEANRDDGRILIYGGTRIGFESFAGGGTLVNHHVPHVGAPARIRSGVDLTNVLMSCDADKQPHHTGINISAMIRCFKMPHSINILGCSSATGHIAAVTAAATGDSLATLRSTTSPGSYLISGFTGNVYAARTTDAVEGAEWANNVFNQDQVVLA